MKCHECNGRGNYYNGKTRLACPFCNGTGEVVGNSEQLKSRSVQRREALQKGEKMPQFDKPVILPPGDPGRCSDCGCDLDKPAGEDCNVRHEDKPEMPKWIWHWNNSPSMIEFTPPDKLREHYTLYLRADFAVEKDNKIDNLKMLLDEANKQIMALKERDRQNTEMVASMTDQLDASLPADKVRELVRLHEDFRDLLLKYRFTPGVPDELNAKAEEIDNLQSALFPEGVEK